MNIRSLIIILGFLGFLVILSQLCCCFLFSIFRIREKACLLGFRISFLMSERLEGVWCLREVF